MQIKTLHGQFSFRLQKYQGSESGKDYFDLTEQMKLGNISPRLEELVAYYSNRLSFSEVENLVTKWTGKRILCDQTIWNRSQAKAVQVSLQLEQEVKVVLSAFSNSLIEVNGQIDIYDPEQSEILLFEDGIQVKEQKEERESLKIRKDDKEEKEAKRRFILTDLAMLQLKNGQYEYIAAPIDESGQRLIDLPEMIKAKVISEYGISIKPLNLLAITDGATSIRHHLQSIFGLSLVIILDWYHLSQKLRSLMSMIAKNKKEKSTHLAYLFPLLWKGKTDEAITYLHKEVKPRKEEQWRELISYLTKHSSEIIDYSRRSIARKPIGSGRMEKGVDLTVGRRQKKKGISWRPKGSRALSLLKVVELNGKWEQLWFPKQTA